MEGLCFGGGIAQFVDEVAHDVGGGCEDHVIFDVDHAESAEYRGHKVVALHRVAAITTVAITSIAAAVAAFSDSAKRAYSAGFHVVSALFLFLKADGSEAIDLVAVIVSGFDLEGEKASDGAEKLVDTGLILELEDFHPRGPYRAFGCVEEDRGVFSESAECLVDGAVEEGAFDAHNILLEVGVELGIDLFE